VKRVASAADRDIIDELCINGFVPMTSQFGATVQISGEWEMSCCCGRISR